MLKLFFILCIFLLTGNNIYAGNKQVTYQDTTNIIDNYDVIEETDDEEAYQAKPNIDKIDTTLQFHNLTIHPDSIEALKNSEAFAYVKNLDSLLKAQQEKKKPKKENSQAKSNFLDNFFSSNVLKILLWGIGILLVLFLLYRLFLEDGIFKKPSAKSKLTLPEVEEENLHNSSNFDLLIEQAISKKNYRLAVRYNYLKSLHRLSDNGLLQIAADKTNYQYVREITNYEYQNYFSALTLHYEYVWYGEFNIDETIYRKMEMDFTKFNNKFK